MKGKLLPCNHAEKKESHYTKASFLLYDLLGMINFSSVDLLILGILQSNIKRV